MNVTLMHSSSRTGRVVAAVVSLIIIAAVAANLVVSPGSVLLALLITACGGLFLDRAELALWAVLLLTPVESIGAVSMLTIKTVKLVLTALTGCALYWRARNRQVSDGGDPYRWPFRMIMFSGFCSTLLAKSLWTSLSGLASLIIFVLFYRAMRCSGVLFEKREKLLGMVMWSGILASACCIAQLFFGYGGLLGSLEQRTVEAEGFMDTFWPGIERGSAAFNGPSAAGAFLAIAALIALSHAQIFQRSRAKYLAAGSLCILGLLATFSRGALLGLLAGCGFASWTLGFFQKRRWWLVAALALVGLPVMFMADGLRNYLRLGSDLVSTSESRVDAWQATRVILARHPIFGIGFYEFREMAQGIEGISDTPQHPHNGFLKALVEQGPLGGCGYLLYVVTFLRYAGRSVRTSSDSSVRWVNGAIAGAGVSLFTQELFDANLSIGGSSLAILFAAFLSLQVSFRSKTETEPFTVAVDGLPC